MLQQTESATDLKDTNSHSSRRGRLFKIALISAILIFMSTIVVVIYFAIGNDDADTNANYKVSVCSEKDVKKAIEAYKNDDGEALQNITWSFVGDDEYQLDAKCNYISVLSYKMAGAKMVMKDYIMLYDHSEDKGLVDSLVSAYDGESIDHLTKENEEMEEKGIMIDGPVSQVPVDLAGDIDE